MKRTAWKQADSVVVKCKLSWLHSHYSDLSIGLLGKSVYIAECEYEVEGKKYRRSLFMDELIDTGKQIPIWYDPKNPARIFAENQKLKWSDGRMWLAIALGIGLAAFSFYRSNGHHW